MPIKKPWTVMVYLAADNNLFTFGVDSLRQMKAAAQKNVNILAEFDTGPTRPAKRYFFDGSEPIGPIERNVVKTFGPTNAADPDNLANFIQWGATYYPAEHYFVIIWGHGGGVDDDFPRRPDTAFVPRHSLLSLFKGTASDFPKGTASDFPKGTASDFPKGTASDFPKGTASDFPKGTASDFPKGTASDFPKGTDGDIAANVLNGHLQRVLEAPMREIVDVLDIENKALRDAVIGALEGAVGDALEGEVLRDLEHFGAPDARKPAFDNDQRSRITELREEILDALHNQMDTMLRDGPLGSVRDGILSALQKGIFDALQSGVLYELQKVVLHAVQASDTREAVAEIRNAALNVILYFLQNGLLEVQQMGLLDFSQKEVLPPTKSLAFVDHPQDFLTNAGLKKALDTASMNIGDKIDILGMDSCNMNMIEIGYEIRSFVDFMLASQDDVPDASWPYDRIIAQLVAHPTISPRDLACQTATTYVDAYRDYIAPAVTAAEQAKLDQPVTLSVLDVEQYRRAIPLIGKLADDLMATVYSQTGVNAISKALAQARKFGENQFIDLIHFCELLTEAEGNPASARSANPSAPSSGNPEIIQLTRTASSILGPLRAIIAANRRSDSEKNCNGTSIYLPQFDPQQEEHDQRLSFFYRELDFAAATGWGNFVTAFLKQQKAQWIAAANMAQQSSGKQGVWPDKIAAQLYKVEELTKTSATELTTMVRESAVTLSSLNGSLNGAARVAAAVASVVKSVAEASKNGGTNGKSHYQTAGS